MRRIDPKTGTPKILEADVKATLKRYLKQKGWLVTTNVQQGYGCMNGRPDLEALKNGVTIYIEVKRPGGQLSPSQRDYLNMLKAYGAICLVISSGEEAVEDVDQVEEQLWPGSNSKRLC